MKQYRNQGAVGAILDEYERALKELIVLISDISNADLTYIVDAETKDKDCRSIQSILSHVVSSGYTYAIYIQNHKGSSLSFREKEILTNSTEYQEALQEMFTYTENVFQSNPTMKLDEYTEQNRIRVRWGQVFDIEQLMEHAIVHILRHRRQIERFLIKIRNSSPV